MRRSYSTTEFRPWNATTLVKTHRIGGCFPTVLSNIGAIEIDYGTIRLTPRMESLRVLDWPAISSTLSKSCQMILTID